jgi:hypothetical protein
MLGLALLLTLVAAGCGSAATGGPTGRPGQPGQPGQPGTSPALVRVGRADDGTTLSARVGDTIQIALGADLDWTLDPLDPAGILRPYAGPVTLIGGVQAQYTAGAPGTATILASGRPRCPADAACTQVIVPFRATVAVR